MHPLRNEKKSSENKKRPMEKKKPPSDDVVPRATKVPPEQSALYMDDTLNQFRLINACFDQIEVSIKNDMKSMVDDKVSMRNQDIDTPP